MKIEKQEIENHQVKLVVEIDQYLLDEAKRRAASRLAKRTKIPGFRPGKAPYIMVVRHLGEAVVLEDAIELLIDDIYPNVIEEAGIETYGPGHLEEIKSLEPPIFEFVVALAPSVELGDYHSIRIPYELAEVTEDQVDDTLRYIQEQNAVIERVERAAQAGDDVRLRFSADRTDSDGAPSILYKENPLTVILPNEGEVIEQYLPVPDFDRSLIGKSAGEVTNLIYNYPADAAIESLRGVQAQFKIQVEQVYSRSLPDMDDELAKSVGDLETLEELRVATREQLEAQERDQYNSDYDEKVLEQLVEMSTVAYPPQMLEHEIDHLVEQFSDRLENQKLDMDLYLKSRGMDMDALREETRPVAENRLKRSLVFFEVSEEEDIEVDPKQLETETLRTLEYYARVLPEKEFKRLSNKESTSGLVGSIMSELVIDNTKEFLRAIAQGKEPHQQARGDEQAPNSEDGNRTTDQPASSEASPLELEAGEMADLISVDDNADTQE